MLRKSAAFFVILALFAGRPGKQPAPPGAKAPARTLVAGLIPEQNNFRRFERYERLADSVRAGTGVAIRLMVFPRYGNIVDDFGSLGPDGAVFGSFTDTLATPGGDRGGNRS